MLTLQQDVVRHMKRLAPQELQGCPLSTDRRTTLPTQWCRHPGPILWPPRAHNVLVSGCTQLQPLRRLKPNAAD